jgi:hypothetical protein
MPDGSVHVLAPSLTIAKAFWQAFTGSADIPIRLQLLHPLYVKEGKPGSDAIFAETGAVVSTLYPTEITGKLDDLWSEVTAHQARGYSVFFFANEISETAGRYASGQNITGIRAGFIDADDGLPNEWHKQPHIVVHSSRVEKDGKTIQKGGAYWFLSDCPPEKFRSVQNALIGHYKSDKAACDLRRVMRMPGGLHRKPVTVIKTGENGEPVLSKKGKPIALKTGELTAPQLVTFTSYTEGDEPFLLAGTIEETLAGIPCDIRAERVRGDAGKVMEGFTPDTPEVFEEARRFIEQFEAEHDGWG